MNVPLPGTVEGALFVLGSLGFALAIGCSDEGKTLLSAANGGSSSASMGGAGAGAATDAGKSGVTGGTAGVVGAGGAFVANGGNASGGASGSSGASGGGNSAGGSGGNTGVNSGGSAGAAAGGRASGGSAASGAAGSANAGTSGRGGAGGGAGANAAGSAGQSAGGVAGSLGCSSGRYLLCEDFESTAVGSTPQGWTRHGDQAAVSDDAAKGGSHSLKLSPVAAAERRIYHDAALLGAAHWGRIFYKVKQPVPDAFVHSTLVSFTGDAPQRGASEFRLIDTVKQAVDTRDVGSLHQYLYNVQVTGGSEFGREGPYDQKFEDTWHCVEYHIEAATQSYALYVDGKEEIAFKDGAGNYSKSDIPSAFKQLRVGWVNYQQAAPGFTAWIDEIAFDDERIGCE